MTTSLTVLTNTPITHRWDGSSPDQQIVFTAAEAAHIRSIVCVTTLFLGSGVILSPDTGTTAPQPVAQSVAYYIVPSGKPARDPTSGAANGTLVFAAGVEIDSTAAPGTVQSPKLNGTTVPIPSGSSLACIATGDFSTLAGTVTINLGA